MYPATAAPPSPASLFFSKYDLLDLESPTQDLGRLLKAVVDATASLFLFATDGPAGVVSLSTYGRSVTRHEGTLITVLRTATDALRVPVSPSEQDEELGRLLQAVLARATSVIIYGQTGQGHVAVTTMAEGKRRGIVQASLADALREAADVAEDRKRCPRCGSTKPLSAFPRDRSRRCGRFSWCSACNRANVAQYSRRNTSRSRSMCHLLSS